MRAALHRLEEGFLAFTLAVMALLTFVQVILRYIFNTGLIWALEANFYLFGWLVLIGISYCVRVKAHIGVDAAVRMLSPGLRRWVGMVVVALALLYAGLMMYGAVAYIDRMMIIDIEAEDIPIKRWILSICLPIGFGLLILRLLEMGWRIVSGQASGYELADEAADALKDVNHDGVPDATGVSR